MHLCDEAVAITTGERSRLRKRAGGPGRAACLEALRHSSGAGDQVPDSHAGDTVILRKERTRATLAGMCTVASFRSGSLGLRKD